MIKVFIFLFAVVSSFAHAQEFITNSESKAIEEMSKRFYKHYEVDDTINGYVLDKLKNGITIIGSADADTNADTRFPQRKKSFKQKVVIKNKNKMYWKVSPTQSFVINPSNLNKGVTFKTQNSWFTLKEESFFAGVSLTW